VEVLLFTVVAAVALEQLVLLETCQALAGLA
jgi:hypothetical protein